MKPPSVITYNKEKNILSIEPDVKDDRGSYLKVRCPTCGTVLARIANFRAEEEEWRVSGCYNCLGCFVYNGYGKSTKYSIR